MRLFNEIYGIYYRIAAMALERRKLADKDINDLIAKHGTEETVLGLAPKLIPAKDPAHSEDLGFFRRTKDGTLESVFTYAPKQYITTLERRWLKSKLTDRRIRLFLSDETIAALEKELGDVKPLYPEGFFRCFDRFSDGDDMSDPEYRRFFGICFTGYKKRKPLRVNYMSGKGNSIAATVMPMKLEYSFKNDKFRMHCRRIKTNSKGFERDCMIINLGRIESVAFAEDLYVSRRRDVRFGEGETQTAVIRVTTERNAVERFMLEFAAYSKTSVRDPSTGECTVNLQYFVGDETELLIRLLGFGPTIEIMSPPRLRRQAADRISGQYERFFGSGSE